MGPDSLASVDIIPVSANATSARKESVSAKTTPTVPNATSRIVYNRRRPIRSPARPTPTVASAIPASIAVKTSPTRASDSPPSASDVPSTTVPNP